MKVSEAKDLVVQLISRDLGYAGPVLGFDASSPDGDIGKFHLRGRPARAIHYYDGWFVPIDLEWFRGGFDPPVIHRGTFHWYVFAIPQRTGMSRSHYLICDYLQVREWVLEFAAPLGRDHRDHRSWRADVRVLLDSRDERTGYFRWGDEPIGVHTYPSRFVELDNAATLLDLNLTTERVGVFGKGGEQTAHRLLKLYVAGHGDQFGLSKDAVAFVEHRFRTGDRVDVMFQNHWPERTVVEVEVAGVDNICTGIHQAIKYRSLAEVEGGYERWSGKVRSLVVAYDTGYEEASRIADRYEVELVTVEPNLVLGSTA